MLGPVGTHQCQGKRPIGVVKMVLFAPGRATYISDMATKLQKCCAGSLEFNIPFFALYLQKIYRKQRRSDDFVQSS